MMINFKKLLCSETKILAGQKQTTVCRDIHAKISKKKYLVNIFSNKTSKELTFAKKKEVFIDV